VAWPRHQDQICGLRAPPAVWWCCCRGQRPKCRRRAGGAGRSSRRGTARVQQAGFRVSGNCPSWAELDRQQHWICICVSGGPLRHAATSAGRGAWGSKTRCALGGVPAFCQEAPQQFYRAAVCESCGGLRVASRVACSMQDVSLDCSLGDVAMRAPAPWILFVSVPVDCDCVRVKVTMAVQGRAQGAASKVARRTGAGNCYCI
jgi:hypothetical protein